MLLRMKFINSLANFAGGIFVGTGAGALTSSGIDYGADDDFTWSFLGAQTVWLGSVRARLDGRARECSGRAATV
jgi:uncharacterized membrane protein